jgi:hypothetical protein
MDDGTIFSMNISWALPQVWPGSVYGLEIGIVGTEGVIDIEDTHRDLVLASTKSQGGGYVPHGFEPPQRHVDFLTSYPLGIFLAASYGVQCVKRQTHGISGLLQVSQHLTRQPKMVIAI